MVLRATSFRRAEALGEEPFALVVLDADQRHLRRKRLTLTTGEELLVDLAKPAHLEAGDRLVLEDGRMAAIVAAPEELMEVTAGDPLQLATLAWHIGNRHTPCQIEAGRLVIRTDHVLADMLRGLGATVTPTAGPFTPEGGAYGLGRTMGHAH